LRYGQHEKILTGSARDTTNNRMELTAAVEALQVLKRPCRVNFYTDSEYLKNGITRWMADWRRRNWRRKGGTLANVDLWQALEAAIQEHQIEWHWVHSHDGNVDNERVDKLARLVIEK
jgi:ribonuclease HI